MDPSFVTEKSLTAFLAKAGLPLGTRLTGLVRWLSFGLAVFCVGLAVALALRGADWFDPVQPCSGLAAPISAAPLFVLSLVASWKNRLHLGAVSMFAGLYALSVIACVPRGVFAPAWTVQPLLATAACAALGAGLGVAFTLLGCAALCVVVFLFGSGAEGMVGFDPTLHGMSLLAVTLGAAVVGLFVHRVMLAALSSDEISRKALRYRERLLRHALRVETVGDLAGLVVHQLRNQFQLAVGHVSLCKREQGEGSTRRLDLIAEALHDSRPLLDQLMSLANPADGRASHRNLTELLEVFAEKVQRVVPARISVHLTLSSETLPVYLDPRGLEHALWNLVINAGHAMPQAGDLFVQTGCSDNQAWVAIEDTGSGIDEENLARIFEPYFTTKAPGEGTGLGLAAVSRYVTSSNGEIDVDSAPGRGTRFTLVFPLVEPSRPSIAVPKAPTAARRPRVG